MQILPHQFNSPLMIFKISNTMIEKCWTILKILKPDLSWILKVLLRMTPVSFQSMQILYPKWEKRLQVAVAVR